MYFVGFKKCRTGLLWRFPKRHRQSPAISGIGSLSGAKLKLRSLSGTQDSGIGTFRGPSAVQDDRVSVLSLREGSMRDLFASNSAADTLPHFVAKNVGA